MLRGLPIASAVNHGLELSETRAALLERHFQSAVLMLDRDAAGQRATAVIAERSSHSMNVTTIRLPDAKQPKRTDMDVDRSFEVHHCGASLAV